MFSLAKMASFLIAHVMFLIPQNKSINYKASTRAGGAYSGRYWWANLVEQHERSARRGGGTKAQYVPSSQYGLQIGYLCCASLGAEEAIDGYTQISCPRGTDGLYAFKQEAGLVRDGA